MVLPHVEEHGLHALGLHHLAVDELHPVRDDVELDRGLEVATATPTCRSAEHRPQCTLTPRADRPRRQHAVRRRARPRAARDAMRGHGAEVELFGCQPEELERAAAAGPHRLAVAGGDGTIGPAAESPAGWGCPWPSSPPAPPTTSRAPTGCRTIPSRRRSSPPPARPPAGWSWAGSPTAGRSSTWRAPGWPPRRRGTPRRSSGSSARWPTPSAPPARRPSSRRSDARLLVDGELVYAGGAWQVIVAVTGAFGGGSNVGVSDPRDGVLDVTILPAGSRLALARRAWGLRRGTIAEPQKPVESHRGHVRPDPLPSRATPSSTWTARSGRAGSSG